MVLIMIQSSESIRNSFSSWITVMVSYIPTHTYTFTITYNFILLQGSLPKWATILLAINVATQEMEYIHLKAHGIYLCILPSDGSMYTRVNGKRQANNTSSVPFFYCHPKWIWNKKYKTNSLTAFKVDSEYVEGFLTMEGSKHSRHHLTY